MQKAAGRKRSRSKKSEITRVGLLRKAALMKSRHNAFVIARDDVARKSSPEKNSPAASHLQANATARGR
jgi:hypothetical protein